jgi:polyketide synthase PksN
MSDNNSLELEIYTRLSKKEITKEDAKQLLRELLERKASAYEEPSDKKNVSINEILSDVAAIVSNNLHISEGELSYDVNFKDLGVDSINGIEMIRDINNKFAINLDAVVLYDYETVAKLSEYVLEQLSKNSDFIHTGMSEAKEAPKVEEVPKAEEALKAKEVPKTKDVPKAKDVSFHNIVLTVVKIVSDNLHLSEDELDYDMSFKDLGIDSINGIEIIRDINTTFGLSLDAVVLYDYSSISSLTGFISEKISQTENTLKVLESDQVSHSEAFHFKKEPVETVIAQETVVLKETVIAQEKIVPQEKAVLEEKVVLEKKVDPQKIEKENSYVRSSSDKTVKLQSPVDVMKQFESRYVQPTYKTKVKLSDLIQSQVSDSSIIENKQKESIPKTSNTKEDIAIVGISGRFPGADNVRDFWKNLMEGKDSIIEIPKKRWDADEIFSTNPREPQKSYSKAGGFLSNIKNFDPLFFNIPPLEAVYMDPQQRIFMEEAWKALEDAGLSDRNLSGEKCGVFVGATQGDYWKLLKKNHEDTSGEAFTGNEPSMFAARIAYFLNLTGPSVTMDTACSSSLVALHLACQNIQSGDSSMALAGGVRLNIVSDLHIATSKLEMLSHKDKCRAFDQEADGTIMSEGVGVVLLMPLKRAQKEGHSIYGIIKGSGINQDGKTNGITAPSAQSQYRLETSVYQSANINPEDISYVEAHGTGTKLGDPIEVKALTNAFRNYTDKKQYCAIGSVKSNIGHTTNAAGIIGLIKVLLAMEHATIPATLHFKKANEHIPFEQTPFYVNAEPMSWNPEQGKNRMAAVSAFGFSGANAHVVVEEYKENEDRRTNEMLPYYLITISAKDIACYEKKIEELHQWLEINKAEYSLKDIAYTLNVGRSHYHVRGALIAGSLSELRKKIKDLVKHKTTEEYFYQQENGKNIRADEETKDQIEALFVKICSNAQSNEQEYRQGLLSVAKYYTMGFLTDCKKIFTDKSYTLLHLPTYPFTKEEYWFEEYKEQPESLFLENKKGLHPMLDENISTLQEQGFQKTFTGEEFFLKDHMVGDTRILPAVAYLEMARIAGDLADKKRKVIKISNNYWLNAIKVEENPKKVKLYFIPEKENEDVVSYEVVSQDNEQTVTLHGKGSITFGSDESEAKKETVSLNQIKERCHETRSGEECYQMFRMAGLNLLRSYQSIQELQFSEDEVLAKIELPGHLKDSWKQFKLHPIIMDGALEAVIGMLSMRVESGGVRLPFYIGEVEILGGLSQCCYSYSRYIGKKKIDLQESECFDVFILDEAGNVLVKIKSFSLWEIGKNVQNKDESDAPMMYYKTIWEQREEVPVSLEHYKKSLLVFDSDEKLTDAIQALSRETVIRVKPSSDYSESGDATRFEINPERKEHYVRMLEKIAQVRKIPERMVYAWTNCTLEAAEPFTMDELNRSLFPVVYLAQALEDMGAGKTYFNYVFDGKKDSCFPFESAFGAFARALHMENNKCMYKSLEFKNTVSLYEKSRLIMNEFADSRNGDFDVLYSKGIRYVKQIKEYEASHVETKTTKLVRKGSYVITGGFGKLGYLFARYLAKEYHAKLCLSSRSPITEEKSRMISELESLGGEVLFVQADISDLNDAKKLYFAAKNNFQKINGVIHCAGMIHDNFLRKKTIGEMKQVIAPKIAGTIHIDLLTQNDELDFFMMFSSTAAVTGNLGQTDYAYANSFMDQFVLHREQLRRKGLREGKSLSINWPLWKDGGMQVDQETEKLFRTMGIQTLKTSMGIQALEDALKSDLNQMIIFCGEQKKIRKFLNVNDEADSKTEKENLERVEQTSYVEQIQQQLINIVCEILRLKKKDIYLEKELSDYGFNSLTLVDLANKINDFYKTELNPSILYEYSTIALLSSYMNQEFQADLAAYYEVSQVEEEKGFLRKIEEGKPEQVEEEKSKTAASSIFRIPARKVLEDTLKARPIEREPIAIVGMSGVMPQSENLEVFWRNLVSSKDLISEVPPERWRTEDVADNIPKWGGFLKEIDKFDPLFFGISPMEAELMDPQQRIFMEVIWKTIEDAGYKPSDLSGTQTGLFVGVSTTDYRDVLSDREIEAVTSTGNSHCILANRISFLLNIHGPSEPIDTACSSSLAAIHRGVESIYNGDCEMALVGGVNVIASPTLHISFGKAGMLSPDGRCKTFDESANGYVRGEGAGAIFLKSLSRAKKDGDHIYGLIKGTGINHGGHASSLTAPNPNAQAQLVKKVIEKSGIMPDTISYIEAHGTGTKLGDPIEINSLIKSFKEIGKKHDVSFKKEYCGIGSVKTNIGHLETAAGIAGVLKVLLAMKYKKLPGLVNLKEQNPFIKLEETPFYLVKETKDWKALIDEHGNELPRRAGISSFGFGGVNAHMILEEYKEEDVLTPTDNSIQIIVLSAKNKKCLKEYIKALKDYLNQEANNQISLSNMAYTLQVGREGMTKRAAFVVNSLDELKDKVNQVLNENEFIEGVYEGNKNTGSKDFLLMEGSLGQEILDILIQNQEYNKLAALWVSGIEFDWSRLHPNVKRKRVSLPTYPFERKRIWAEKDSKKVIHLPPEKEKQVSREETVDITQCFYKQYWRNVELPLDLEKSLHKKTGKKVLIMIPEDNEDILNRLLHYHKEDDVTIMILGLENKRLEENRYQINVFNENAVESCLERLHTIDTIYFLGGLLPKVLDVENIDSLNQSQEQGIITLFRLVKCLTRKELDNKTLQFYVWTNHVTALTLDERNMPNSASILGFVKTMAKEYLYWNVSCVDFDDNDFNGKKADELFQMLIHEPPHSQGNETVIRGQKRYERSISSIDTDKIQENPFRKDGVYVILGGAGGIGLEFARYLSKTVHAKIALIGRSGLPEEKKEKIAEIERLGGKILYVKANAADVESMRHAVAEIKSNFGSIHGVIHSAIVMKDSSIRNMEESNLREAMSPKVQGSMILYQVMKNEMLDFIMFFSSIQTFIGNLGQGNYAAACAYKDAFADYIRNQKKIKVKTINWGYWGTVGVASSKAYNQKMLDAGLGSIVPEEGMEAITQITAHSDLDHIAVIKAEEALLKKSGIETKNREIKKKSIKKMVTPNHATTKEEIVKRIKEKIINSCSEILKVDRKEVDSDISFSEYGVDSITGMKLIKNINETFQINLKSTALFDYSNIDALGEYLWNEYNTEVTTPFQHYEEESDTYSDRVKTQITNNHLSVYQQVEQKVMQCLSQALGVESSDIDSTMSFSDCGVDSITGLTLIKTINENFGISLKSTVLFDYSNIYDFSNYLIKEHKESVAGIVQGNEENVFIPDTSQDSEENVLQQLADGTMDIDEVFKLID